jgi:hypothetical protein
MNNINLIKIILSYLPKDDLLPKYLLVNKKLSNWLQDEWKEYQETEPLKTHKYHFNVVKYNPPYYNVEFSRFISIQRMTTYNEIEVIQMEIKAHPVYPGHKIGVRYTINNWATFEEVSVGWCCNEDGKEVWRQHFVLDSPNVGNRVEFAIFGRDVTGRTFWNNNEGRNYEIATRNY